MNITFQTFSLNGTHPVFTGTNGIAAQCQTKPMANDCFVRSKDINFTAIDKHEAKELAKDLATIGIVGGGFLLALAGASSLMARTNPTDIFLPDGTYLMSVDDMKLKTDRIEADGVTGAINFKGTKINIEPEKYDYVDTERGIYRNNDGSVDIDLLNHKYIDVENKIFIDPERKISAMFDGEAMHNIVIPDFTFKGSSMSGNQYPFHQLETRSQYYEKNGHYPEDDHSQYTQLHMEHGTRIVDPDDNRDILQKLADYFNPLSANKFPNHKFDRGKDYDIFGREIISVKDNEGNVTKIAIDEKITQFAKEHHFDKDQIGDIVNFIETTRLKDYLKDKNDFADLEVAGFKTMDEFVNGTSIHINHDTETENPEVEHPDTDHNTIVELFDGILVALNDG